jgi:hypothetical protein
MQKIYNIFFLLVFLSSCSFIKEDVLEPANLWKPRPFGMEMEGPKDASPIFKQGWKDGCETGLAAYGSDHYRNLGYKFKQDISQINNTEYYMAWQNSYRYCRWYIWNYNRDWMGVPSTYGGTGIL